MLKRLCIIFPILLITTSILQVISYDIYFGAIRDNFHYSNFYDQLVLNKNIFIGYRNLYNLTGGSEPFYFIFMWLMAFVGFEYSQAIILQNIIFVLIISIFISSFKFSRSFFLLAIIYVSFDYYLFVLFSEAQRLKLGFMMGLLFLYLYLHNRKATIPAVGMIFSHFQMGILLILLFRKIKFNFYYLIPLILLTPLYQRIFEKILKYIKSDLSIILGNIISSTILAGLFIIASLLMTRKMNKIFLFFLFICICASAVVGKMRINIFIFEGGVMYLFYLVYVKNLTKKNISILCFVIMIISCFNVYKIEDSYTFLVQLVKN